MQFTGNIVHRSWHSIHCTMFSCFILALSLNPFLTWGGVVVFATPWVFFFFFFFFFCYFYILYFILKWYQDIVFPSFPFITAKKQNKTKQKTKKQKKNLFLPSLWGRLIKWVYWGGGGVTHSSFLFLIPNFFFLSLTIHSKETFFHRHMKIGCS